ncbi:MAG: hypothetical protein LLG42_04220 [Chloroflexi bacterium]|nr:hypothetical protein [Chloroflexota bacterium]
MAGVFNVTGKKGLIKVQAPDGEYGDRMTGKPVRIHHGILDIPESANVFECLLQIEPELKYSSWMI